MLQNLLENETYELLEKSGLSVPKWIFVQKGDEPRIETGKKYVAKIVDRKIIHKSDLGGVIFNVTNLTAKDVCSKLLEKFGDADGVLFVEEIPYEKNSEILMGAYLDPFFGPLITVGFGGTGTDFFEAVMKKGNARATFPANLEYSNIQDIVASLPVVKMITGNIRGYKKLVELDEVFRSVSIFQKIISSDYKNRVMEEIEANPMICSAGRILALDGFCKLKEKTEKKVKKPIHKIGNLLNPKSACIVGASGKNPYNPANIILKNLLNAGLDQKDIYLVHPKEENIEGIKCIVDILSLMKIRDNKPVDLLVVGIPAKSATDLIEESFRFNAAQSIQVISAGFGETEAGKELQKKLETKLHLLDATPEKRPVINGPNTLGNIYNNKKTLFTSPQKSSGTGKGHTNAALICQSGAFMITEISNLAGMINPITCASVGNQMDITVIDCLEYLLDDPNIKTYGLYIEGLKDGDGSRLMELSRRASTFDKYVVIYKAGRTKEGVDAAKGHTAAMAGDYNVFENLMALSGSIIADTFTEFQNLIMLTALVKPVKKSAQIQIAALSNAGYEKCSIADHLMKSGNKRVKLAEYSEDTISKILSIYEAHKISGIMDIHDILDLTPMMDDSGYEEVIRATLSDENVNFGIYSIVPETLMLKIAEAGSGKEEGENGILARLIKINKEIDKPFVVSMESGWKYDNFAARCIEAGIPCFRRVDAASRSVAKLLGAIAF